MIFKQKCIRFFNLLNILLKLNGEITSFNNGKLTDTDIKITVNEKGKEISFGDLDEDIILCHAGTAMKDGKLVTAGGRVLGATETADTLEAAVKGAYGLVEKISFNGAFYRKDIGKRALDRR